jgi:hypothetical protein
MMSCETDPVTGVVDIVVDGALTRADYDVVVAALDAAIAAHGTLRVVETIKSVGRIDPSLWWKDLHWAFANFGKIGRCAVVTDQGWVGSITRAVAAVMPSEIRVFPLAEGESARAWVREA